MRSIFKKESFMMTLVLICYGLLAGGSVDSIFDPVFWKLLFHLHFWEIVITILFIALIIVAIIYSITISIKNGKKRIQLKNEFESQEKELNLSDKYGDDRIGLYFDNDKEKALIISITTKGINKHYIDSFKKDIIKVSSYYYCAIDMDRRKALLVQYEDKFNYKLIECANKDINKSEVINNNIPAQLYIESLRKKKIEPFVKPTCILLDEKYGYVSIIRNLSVKSFNYINKDLISQKEGNTTFITQKKIGSYVFLMDEYYKVIIIISPLISEKVLNYSDIINVTYEEDGNTLYSKSMARTVGGAIVGGALIGGAGAIVGGLSGDTSQNKKVQSMNIKILVRSTTSPSINLPINLNGETFNTKDEKSKNAYKSRIKEANAIKDLISVIIDNSNLQQAAQVTMNSNPETPKQVSNIADELTKLAQLKDAGILSEEEFQQQKKKLLS